MLPNNKTWSFLRREVQRFMPDSITIYSVARTYTSESGYSQVRTVVASGVKGQIHDASGSERRLLQTLVDVGTENIETAKLGLPYGTSITTENEVMVNGDGRYWNIHSTNTGQTFTAVTEALLYRKLVNQVVQE